MGKQDGGKPAGEADGTITAAEMSVGPVRLPNP